MPRNVRLDPFRIRRYLFRRSFRPPQQGAHMRKLKLSLENLAVETFDPEKPAENARGTVHARNSWYATNEEYSCDYVETCGHWHTCYIDCTMLCTREMPC